MKPFTRFPRALGLALLLLALLLPAPARAALFGDVQAIFSQDKKDPYEAVFKRFVEQATLEEQQGDLLSAYDNLRIAATIKRTDRAVIAQGKAVKAKLEAAAEEHYKAAVALYDKGDLGKARQEFIACLRLNPERQDAVDYVKNKLAGDVFTYYKVKDGDTIASLALAQYQNPDADLLITRVNGLTIADKLRPGQTLRLPIVPANLRGQSDQQLAALNKPKTKEAAAAASAAAAAIAAAPVVPVVSAIPAVADQPKAVDSASLLSMARMQISNGVYETAISMTDEVLAADKGNSDAKQLQMEATYLLGADLKKRNSHLQAVKTLKRLPESYRDTGKLVAESIAELNKTAEPKYLEGVKYFIAEQLQQAVDAWEQTLQLNPWHAKAQGDLVKARKLLEAVKGK
jgi:tetratricopeptide (TPR) repeat protein